MFKPPRPLCLFTQGGAPSASLKVYNLIGEMVAHPVLTGPGNQCWNTQGTAPGLYIVDISLTYPDGSTAYSRKKILITP